MDDRQINHSVDDLPESVIVNCVFEVVGFFDEEGVQRYVTRADGAVPVSTIIGLAHMGLYEVLKDNSDES